MKLNHLKKKLKILIAKAERENKILKNSRLIWLVYRQKLDSSMLKSVSKKNQRYKNQKK
jgi:uncharacterized protein (DUF1697 family)